MAWNEQLPEWNATGVEPPASKKNEGWKPDDRPPADWFNWLFNRAYKVMQEIRIMLGGHVDAAAPHSGHETPAGATAKASAAETNAKGYTDTHAGAKDTHGTGAGYYIAKTSRSDQMPAYADVQGKPSSFPPSTHTHQGGDITSKVGSATVADAVPWAGVSDKPASFAPSAHKSTHVSGGADALTPADIGAATIGDLGGVQGDVTTLQGELATHQAETVTQEGGVHDLEIEAGTFTPVVRGSLVAGANSYNYQRGSYYKIGNRVFWDIFVQMTSKDSAMSGNILIDGLPFALTAIGGLDVNSACAIARVSLLDYDNGSGNVETLVAYVAPHSKSYVSVGVNSSSSAPVLLDVNKIVSMPFIMEVSGNFQIS